MRWKLECHTSYIEVEVQHCQREYVVKAGMSYLLYRSGSTTLSKRVCSESWNVIPLISKWKYAIVKESMWWKLECHTSYIEVEVQHCQREYVVKTGMSYLLYRSGSTTLSKRVCSESWNVIPLISKWKYAIVKESMWWKLECHTSYIEVEVRHCQREYVVKAGMSYLLYRSGSTTLSKRVCGESWNVIPLISKWKYNIVKESM